MKPWNPGLLRSNWRNARRLTDAEIALNLARYAICIFFAALTVRATVGLWRSLAAVPTEYSLSNESTDIAVPRTPNARDLAERIASQHLFGKVTATPHSPPSKPAERTSGSVKLAGVIFGGEEMPSRAILAVGGKQRSYRPGQRLPAGDVLTDVRMNKVILNGAQGRYSLVLRHESDVLLAEPPHFDTTTNNNGITVVELTGPSAARADHATPAASTSMSTLQRLKALRMRLLGAGNGND